MKNLIGFVACDKCYNWSKIPEGFNELKHFAKCPTCNQPMYLTRQYEPEEMGYRSNQEIKATLMSNKGY